MQTRHDRQMKQKQIASVVIALCSLFLILMLVFSWFNLIVIRVETYDKLITTSDSDSVEEENIMLELQKCEVSRKYMEDQFYIEMNGALDFDCNKIGENRDC